jgi:hypothetical protein
VLLDATLAAQAAALALAREIQALQTASLLSLMTLSDVEANFLNTAMVGVQLRIVCMRAVPAWWHLHGHEAFILQRPGSGKDRPVCRRRTSRGPPLFHTRPRL